MDESLYTRSQLMMLAPTKGHKKAHVLDAKEHLTMIPYLSYMFRPNQKDTPKSTYVNGTVPSKSMLLQPHFRWSTAAYFSTLSM